MLSVTFRTAEGDVTVYYRLAAGVAAAKAFVREYGFGTWLGDMGNAAHQWNDGLPSHGRRHGDHTAWSSDGPPDVVKAFDWKPPAPPAGRVAFKPWLLAQLRAGRYRAVCKFINIANERYSGSGVYQGWSADEHLHWSYLPAAVNSTVNPIADYYREVIQEDDMANVTDAQLRTLLDGAGRSSEIYLRWYHSDLPASRADMMARIEVLTRLVTDLSAMTADEIEADIAERTRQLAADNADAERDAALATTVANIPGADPDAQAEALAARLRTTVPADVVALLGAKLNGQVG